MSFNVDLMFSNLMQFIADLAILSKVCDIVEISSETLPDSHVFLNIVTGFNTVKLLKHLLPASNQAQADHLVRLSWFLDHGSWLTS